VDEGIDRSEWGPEDYEAERQARELVTLATGQPPPPPPPPPAAPPQGDETLTALGFLRRIGFRIRAFGRGSRLWLSLVALFAVLLTISGAIWVTTRNGDDAAADPGSGLIPAAAAESNGAAQGGDEPAGDLDPGVTPAPGAGDPEDPASEVDQPGGSAGDPEEPAGSSEQPGAGSDGASLADAVGVYRLVGSSAHDAMSPVVAEFYSAEGVLVVGADGAVSGEITYLYADEIGEAGGGDLADVVFDGTLTAVDLDAADDGFTFESTMEVVLDVTPRPPADDDVVVPAPFTRSITMQVVGVVDLDLGTIGLRQSGDQDDSGMVIFRR
jgi:hypothetical protein